MGGTHPPSGITCSIRAGAERRSKPPPPERAPLRQCRVVLATCDGVARSSRSRRLRSRGQPRRPVRLWALSKRRCGCCGDLALSRRRFRASSCSRSILVARSQTPSLSPPPPPPPTKSPSPSFTAPAHVRPPAFAVEPLASLHRFSAAGLVKGQIKRGEQALDKVEGSWVSSLSFEDKKYCSTLRAPHCSKGWTHPSLLVYAPRVVLDCACLCVRACTKGSDCAS